MIKAAKRFYHQYPKSVWNMTFILFLLVLRKTLLNTMRDSTAVIVDSNSSLGVIVIVSMFLYLMVHNTMVKNVYVQGKSFANYCILALLSVLWASNYGYILYKGVEVLLSYMLICLAIYKINDLRKAIIYTLFLCTMISIVDYCYHFRFFHSFIMHTNTYTISSMIGGLICLGLIRMKTHTFKQLNYCIFINGFILISGTSSASYISAIGGAFVLFSITKKKIHWGFLIIMLAIIYILGDYILPLVSDYIFYGHSVRDIQTGTGREYIWKAAIESWKEAPMLGKGYAVGEKSLFEEDGTIVYRSTHNGILSVMVNTGLVGLFLFFNAIYKWFYFTIRKMKTNSYAVAIFPAMVGAFINILSCPVLGSDWYPQSLCYYALMAIAFIYFSPSSKLSSVRNVLFSSISRTRIV